jgi:hypothetical protein
MQQILEALAAVSSLRSLTIELSPRYQTTAILLPSWPFLTQLHLTSVFLDSHTREQPTLLLCRDSCARLRDLRSSFPMSLLAGCSSATALSKLQVGPPRAPPVRPVPGPWPALARGWRAPSGQPLEPWRRWAQQRNKRPTDRALGSPPSPSQPQVELVRHLPVCGPMTALARLPALQELTVRHPLEAAEAPQLLELLRSCRQLQVRAAAGGGQGRPRQCPAAVPCALGPATSQPRTPIFMPPNGSPAQASCANPRPAPHHPTTLPPRPTRPAQSIKLEHELYADDFCDLLAACGPEVAHLALDFYAQGPLPRQLGFYECWSARMGQLAQLQVRRPG